KQARPKANIDLFLTNMNGAVATAGGDLAKAALQAGLIDRVGDRRAYEARLAELGGGPGNRGAAFKEVKLASYVNDVVDRKPTGPTASRRHRCRASRTCSRARRPRPVS